MIRVDVKPALLRWARKRAGVEVDALISKFPKYGEWETGDVQPTLKQLKKFANATHTTIGDLFLSKPPKEEVLVPDFRTMGNAPSGPISVDLRDTIYMCLQRQDWYREYARMEEEDPVAFVGSARLEDDAATVAAEIRETLGLDLDERKSLPTWTAALRQLIDKADAMGVLVMVSSIVRSDTKRKLDPNEFRGFALPDDLAPLIFISGADSKAAQMFTLVHELAHIWLGQAAISDARMDSPPTHDTERWCNRVAAEVLVPLAVLRNEYENDVPLVDELSRLARRFKVSTLVVLCRIRDARWLTDKEFRDAYDIELNKAKPPKQEGGRNFYNTHFTRVGKRFTQAIITDTMEGKTPFTLSFYLLGFKKMAVFDELARRLEIVT